MSEMWVSAVLAAIPSFSFGYQLGAPDAAAPALRACTHPTCFPVDTTSPEWGLAVGQMCVGALIGSLLFGRVCDGVGRRRAVIVVNLFYICGLVLTYLSMSLWWFGVGRGVIGVAVGGSCVAVPVYLSDLVAVYDVVEWRGIIASAHQMAIVIGYFVIQLLAIFVKGMEWRWLYTVNLVICIIHSLLFMVFSVDPKSTRTEETETDTILEIVARPEARQSLFMACLLHLVQQFSGINGVFSYAGELFKSTWWVPLALSVLNLIMTVVSMLLLERLGRRPLLLASVLVCILALVSATLAPTASLASTAVLAYVAGFAVGLGPVPWLMIAELFPKSATSSAVSLAVATNWTCNFMVTSGFPVMARWLGGYKFVPFVACLVGFLVVAWFRLPETRGRPPGYIIM